MARKDKKAAKTAATTAASSAAPSLSAPGTVGESRPAPTPQPAPTPAPAPAPKPTPAPAPKPTPAPAPSPTPAPKPTPAPAPAPKKAQLDGKPAPKPTPTPAAEDKKPAKKKKQHPAVSKVKSRQSSATIMMKKVKTKGVPKGMKTNSQIFTFGSMLFWIFMMVCCYYQPGGPVWDPYEGHESEYDEWSPGKVSGNALSWFFFLCILGVFILTLLKDKMERSTPKSFDKYMTAMFSEMTIFTYIAILMFMLMRQGMLVDMVGPGGCKEHVVNLFVRIQYYMFVFFILYLFFTVWIMWCLLNAETLWIQYETDLLAHGDSVSVLERAVNTAAMHAQYPKTILPGVSDPLPGWQASDITAQFQFCLYRQRFINTKELNRPAIPDSFRFYKYLVPAGNSITTQMCSINAVSWIMMAFFTFIVFEIGAIFPVEVIRWLLLTLGWSVFAFCIATADNLTKIKMQLVVSHPLLHHKDKEEDDEEDEDEDEEEESTHRKRRKSKKLAIKMQEKKKESEKFDSANAKPEYLENLNPNNGLNKHQALLPFGKNAETFYVVAVQMIMLVSIWFIPICVTASYNNMHIHYVFWSTVPIWISVFYSLPNIIRDVPIVLRIEMNKDWQLIEEVGAELQVEKSMFAMKIVNAMASELNKVKKNSGMSKGKHADIEPSKKKMLAEHFHRYDENDEGEINQESLLGLMNSIGSPVSAEELDMLMLQLDSDGSNTISFEEFCDAVAIGEDKPNIDEVATMAFKSIDIDRKGEINVHELKEYLAELNTGLSEDELNVVVSEINIKSQVDGSVTQKEFIAAIDSMHMPMHN